MDTNVRLLAAPGAPLERARAAVEALAARLTRFDAASELSALNADSRAVVPVSPVLRADLACSLLAPYGPAVADCGGDVRVAGRHAVNVRHPLTGGVAHVLVVR